MAEWETAHQILVEVRGVPGTAVKITLPGISYEATRVGDKGLTIVVIESPQGKPSKVNRLSLEQNSFQAYLPSPYNERTNA